MSVPNILYTVFAQKPDIYRCLCSSCNMFSFYADIQIFWDSAWLGIFCLLGKKDTWFPFPLPKFKTFSVPLICKRCISAGIYPIYFSFRCSSCSENHSVPMAICDVVYYIMLHMTDIVPTYPVCTKKLFRVGRFRREYLQRISCCFGRF